jgi:hypothetical protein
MRAQLIAWLFVVVCGCASLARGGVGDPQIMTDHPYYPGELAASTWERLFATQARLYEAVTGQPVKTEQDRVLAAWLWRNTHYFHGEPGSENLWGQGFTAGGDSKPREYWSGLYAHGYGLCGTTHAQWVPEMQALLGHNRARTVGTDGHNSFEVFLKGGAYGDGKWVLLDHDISTVIFDAKGESLLSIAEIARDWKKYAARNYPGNAACGWLPCGLHPDDGGVYASYNVAEYFSGYAGPPPVIYLRRGETLRRYLEPGLEDGQTFVFWGRNYNTGGIPGPERSHTWVNQPDKMYQSKTGAGYKPGQARYGNAVYTFAPDFASENYREAVIDESPSHVTLEFTTPYIIGATPPSSGNWDIYKPGGKNGLIVTGTGDVPVAISVDRGATWSDGGKLTGAALDLTDLVKGYRQYWIKLGRGAKELSGKSISLRTVCQMNAAMISRLHDGENQVTLNIGERGLVSAGPTLPQAQAHIIAGEFDSPTVTLELAPPRHAQATHVYAAAHMRSSSPPNPEIAYAIDYSTDGGKSWLPVVSDWRITRRGDEPPDFWSQSFCFGDVALPTPSDRPVQVRFKNNGGKRVARAEIHLLYKVPRSDDLEVTFGYTNAAGEHTKTLSSAAGDVQTLDAGKNVQTRWVELK